MLKPNVLLNHSCSMMNYCKRTELIFDIHFVVSSLNKTGIGIFSKLTKQTDSGEENILRWERVGVMCSLHFFKLMLKFQTQLVQYINSRTRATLIVSYSSNFKSFPFFGIPRFQKSAISPLLGFRRIINTILNKGKRYTEGNIIHF